jgi:hypothetical protein
MAYRRFTLVQGGVAPDFQGNSRSPLPENAICHEELTASACHPAIGYRMAGAQASCKNRARQIRYGIIP